MLSLVILDEVVVSLITSCDDCSQPTDEKVVSCDDLEPADSSARRRRPGGIRPRANAGTMKTPVKYMKNGIFPYSALTVSGSSAAQVSRGGPGPNQPGGQRTPAAPEALQIIWLLPEKNLLIP